GRDDLELRGAGREVMQLAGRQLAQKLGHPQQHLVGQLRRFAHVAPSTMTRVRNSVASSRNSCCTFGLAPVSRTAGIPRSPAVANNVLFSRIICLNTGTSYCSVCVT